MGVTATKIKDLNFINQRFLLSLFFSLLYIILFSQENKKGFPSGVKLNDLSITYWTTDNGLPSNNVNELFQSEDGYIWIASFEGFIKFDGVKFSIIDHQKQKAENSIGGYSIYSDHAGQIWVCTLGKGLLKYDGNILKEIVADNKILNSVRRVYEDSKDRFWIGGINHGLYLKEDNKYKKIEYSELENVTIQSIAEDEKGRLWFASEGKGVSFLENDKFKTITRKDGLYSDLVLNVFPDKDGNIWIGTTKGMCKYNKDGEIVKIPQTKGVSIREILLDDYNLLWLATTKGIQRYNIKTSELEVLSENEGLPDQDIGNLIFDKEGSLWAGSARRGIFQLKQTSFSNLVNKEKPFLKKINVVGQVNDDEILLGGDNGKVYSYKNNQFSQLSIKSDFSGLRIRSVFKDSKGFLWITSYAGVLKKKDEFEVFYNAKNGLPTDQARVIYEDYLGQIWVGTRNGGVIKFNDHGIEKIISINDGLSSNFIMSITGDSLGNLFAGTVGGGLVHIKNDKVVDIYKSENNISEEVVFNTFIDNKGALWISDNKGLSRYYKGKFASITSENGLLIERPFDYLEDNLGFVWIPSVKGILRVEKKQLEDFAEGKIKFIKSKLFDNEDGMITKDCIGATKSFKSKDGVLWFPTVKGVTYIDPDKILTNKIIPPVLILDIKADGKLISPSANIEFPSNTKHYLFEYTALSLVAPSKVNFKYKLEGFDQEWLVPEDNNRYVSYTNLPYGNYKFKVIASNNSGLWNEKGAEISFFVKPAFHETIYFYIIIFISSLLILWFGINFRTKLMRKKSLVLKKLVANRTEEIEEQKQEIEAQSEKLLEANLLIQSKNEELSNSNQILEDKVFKRTYELRKALKELDQFIYRTAHDLMGPVARLVGLCNLAKIEPDKEMIIEYVKTIETNSIDMKSLLNRLMRAQGVKFENPRISKVNFKTLIKSIYDSFSDHPNYNKINFIVEAKQDLDFYSDSALIGYLFENLLDNSFNYVDDNKKENYIKIEINQGKDQECRIDIIDNGIGILKEVSGKIYQMFYRGTEQSSGFGLGLYESKLIVKKLRGKIWHRMSNKEETEFLIYLPSNENASVLSAEIEYKTDT